MLEEPLQQCDNSCGGDRGGRKGGKAFSGGQTGGRVYWPGYWTGGSLSAFQWQFHASIMSVTRSEPTLTYVVTVAPGLAPPQGCRCRLSDAG